ncbi:MAG: hypothetical protein A3D92_18360 [Bacteroidetes bacterium RIFCSPHIGHO2_02_FULL_44_7]|nr:MAG: hypothetical protein A3D92_18360 [Bacteroidetes bacterium RIFCSPHIGHO2_02_FULL_44_7]
MKLEEFRKLLEKPYLFHLHTRYTDGHLEVEDYFCFAQEHGVETIFFTEHVRRELKYDFSAFAAEIRVVATRYPGIRGVVGAEAKILPGGDLDIHSNTFDEIDVLCFACHGFPDDDVLYFDSFRKLLGDERWKSKIRVFVHPGRYLKKRHIEDAERWDKLEELLAFGMENGVFIEDNRREYLPKHPEKIPGASKVIGYDIHQPRDLERWLSEQGNG